MPSGQDYYRSVAREREPIQYMERVDRYYTPQYPTQYAPPPPAYVPAPVGSYSQAREYPRDDYYSSGGGYENPSRVYVDPNQRQGVGQAGGNAPVSALYAFAGPVPTYRN